MTGVWSDSPITTKNNDEFGRADYAAHAAHLIAESHSWEDSIVFGLTGPWGSGKSSMIAMIAEELEATQAAWRVARFTPWATGDVAGLLGDFYASLAKALPMNRSKKVRNALGTLAQVTAPAANGIPWVGGVLASVVGSTGKALKQPTPWDTAFKAAAAELRTLQTPVLLIADDIDRLQTEELLALLKVVRLLGRFPGVHYLLAYDENTLFQALSEANLVGESDGSAGRFMEKIVQYPLVVPPLLWTQLLSRLDAGIDAALSQARRPQPASGRLGQLSEVYRSQLSTPRAIDRYLAQLRHHLPMLPPDEIDDEDVIVLTLLRTAFPTLYQRLPRWREQLISGHTDEFKHGAGGIEYERFDIEPLMEGIPKQSQHDARTLLIDLFPKLKSVTMSFGTSNCRINDTRYFDRYFAMAIPSYDVSDVEVMNAVVRAGQGHPESLASLLTQSDSDRVVLVADKGRRFTEENPQSDFDDESRLELIKHLVAIHAQVLDKQSFFMSPRERVASWAGLIVAQLSDAVKAQALLDALGATQALWENIQIVSYADRDDRPRPACLDEVVAELGARATATTVEHLRAQDQGDDSVRPGWLIHFLISTGQIAPLQTAIAAGLKSGEFTIADVAARAVETHTLYGVGTVSELGDFDQATFNALVPSISDPWYASPRTEVDKHDLSWANRRIYAAGRAKQPPPP